VLRSREGLEDGAGAIDVLAEKGSAEPGTEAWETTNLLTVSRALVAAALAREETRGSHWRDDFPERDDDRWARHLDVRLVHGEVRLRPTGHHHVEGP
jgi:L-aspartate oxidase